MTKEEAIFCEKSYIGETNCTDCKYYGTDTCQSRVSHKMAINALEQQPCDDCVSREDVKQFVEYIQSIKDSHNTKGTPINFGTICDLVIRGWKLMDLPPVAPTFPKGATNGDMMKAMFPNCKDWKAKLEDNDGEVYEVHFVQLPNSLIVNKYEESWWNAPYKRGDIDGSN